VVSDVHGAHEALGKLLRADDLLISLGDHVNVLDYKDLTGILASFVSKETINETLDLIQNGDLEAARSIMTRSAGSVPHLFAKVKEAADKTYAAVSAAIPCPAHFIYGNVDFPETLRANLKANQQYHEADVLDIEGRRFGLVSGHPPGPFSFGMPGEVDKKVFALRLHQLGHVDVLCMHSPPAIDGMTYDVIAARDEEGSPDSLYFAKLHRPRLVLFGHIHRPRVAEFVDQTVSDAPIRYLNVGCFRDTGRLLRIDPATLETEWVNS